jgi:putative transposase
MPRIARVVVPQLPHHVTQRGNRREPIFFRPGDQVVYRKLLGEQTRKARVEVWAYCLMPNHVHLIATPNDEYGLALAIGEAHRRYTAFVNAREGWTGHLFQSRFASVVMDEDHLVNAVRYVSLNPVRAGLCSRAEDWPWSSARAHLGRADDALATVRPLLDRIDDFAELLRPENADSPAFAALRKAESSGRPLGSNEFVARMEQRLGRSLSRRPPGPQPRGSRGSRGQDTYPLI